MSLQISDAMESPIRMTTGDAVPEWSRADFKICRGQAGAANDEVVGLLEVKAPWSVSLPNNLSLAAAAEAHDHRIHNALEQVMHLCCVT